MYEDLLPFPLSRRERELIEVFVRATSTRNSESNSDFEKHEDLLPFPLSLWERAGVRGF
jgi:hypothetical protein